MFLPRVFIIPSIIASAIAGYIVVNPAGSSVGEPATDETPSAAASPYTPAPTLTPEPAATTAAVGPLPDGLTGRLTYRTGGDLVTVQLPDAVEVTREEVSFDTAQRGETSADGAWRARTECPADNDCNIVIEAADGSVSQTIDLGGDYAGWLNWSREGHALAYSVTPPGAIAARELMLIDDPALPSPRPIHNADGIGIYSYVWTSATDLLASLGGGSADKPYLISIATNGSIRRLADTTSPVYYMYASEDGRRVAFTMHSVKGWRMLSFDTRTEELRDLGNMGSDGPGDATPEESPAGESKGPMYVAWSPDGTRLAFGGGFQPPYTMTTVDVTTGNVARTTFPAGYPGEIKWTRDSSKIAVSTYDIERTHHETWVVDPLTGVGTYIMDGCVIVWSPDGRFLAVHGEREPGIAIVDAATGAGGRLTQTSSDAPVRWEP